MNHIRFWPPTTIYRYRIEYFFSETAQLCSDCPACMDTVIYATDMSYAVDWQPGRPIVSDRRRYLDKLLPGEYVLFTQCAVAGAASSRRASEAGRTRHAAADYSGFNDKDIVATFPGNSTTDACVRAGAETARFIWSRNGVTALRSTPSVCRSMCLFVRTQKRLIGHQIWYR